MDGVERIFTGIGPLKEVLNSRFNCDNFDKIDDLSSYKLEGIYIGKTKMHKESEHPCWITHPTSSHDRTMIG